MEQDNKISTEVSSRNIDPISYFSDEGDFVLAYKKTEKLASAVYMISNLFSDSEPMKWTLRKKVSELLSLILTYKDISRGTVGDFIYSTKTRTFELISLLEISFRAGLISEMNFSIIRQEFLNLINILDTANPFSKNSSGEKIPKNFFVVSQNYSNSEKSQPDTFDTEKTTKTLESTSVAPKMSFNDIKDSGLDGVRDNLKKTNRQNIILGLLKKRKELTIKDIALVIKDCSEKTIQRELNSFISVGVLKRSGVRRWSKYSLA